MREKENQLRISIDWEREQKLQKYPMHYMKRQSLQIYVPKLAILEREAELYLARINAERIWQQSVSILATISPQPTHLSPHHFLLNLAKYYMRLNSSIPLMRGQLPSFLSYPYLLAEVPPAFPTRKKSQTKADSVPPIFKTSRSVVPRQSWNTNVEFCQTIQMQQKPPVAYSSLQAASS